MKRFFAIPLFLCTFLTGQSSSTTSQGPPGGDVFFLDLGIVIESTTGEEKINRLVKTPPEKVAFFLNKAPSGSVFMASTKEIQETLYRIGDKIEKLEHALRKEVSILREENEELREMVADLLAREPVSHPLAEAVSYEPPPVPGMESGVAPIERIPAGDPVSSEEPGDGGDPEPFTDGEEDDPEGGLPTEPLLGGLMAEGSPFNKTVYMNAVFAYQREDYGIALEHFSRLPLGKIDQVTAGNVLYWISDCHYQLGEYGDALRTLAAIRPFFNSDRQDDAMILTGLVYRQLGNETEAIQAFANIVDDHPDSEYFKLAQMELRKSTRQERVWD